MKGEIGISSQEIQIWGDCLKISPQLPKIILEVQPFSLFQVLVLYTSPVTIPMSLVHGHFEICLFSTGHRMGEFGRAVCWLVLCTTMGGTSGTGCDPSPGDQPLQSSLLYFLLLPMVALVGVLFLFLNFPLCFFVEFFLSSLTCQGK